MLLGSSLKPSMITCLMFKSLNKLVNSLILGYVLTYGINGDNLMTIGKTVEDIFLSALSLSLGDGAFTSRSLETESLIVVIHT